MFTANVPLVSMRICRIRQLVFFAISKARILEPILQPALRSCFNAFLEGIERFCPPRVLDPNRLRGQFDSEGTSASFKGTQLSFVSLSYFSLSSPPPTQQECLLHLKVRMILSSSPRTTRLLLLTSFLVLASSLSPLSSAICSPFLS